MDIFNLFAPVKNVVCNWSKQGKVLALAFKEFLRLWPYVLWTCLLGLAKRLAKRFCWPYLHCSKNGYGWWPLWAPYPELKNPIFRDLKKSVSLNCGMSLPPDLWLVFTALCYYFIFWILSPFILLFCLIFYFWCFILLWVAWKNDF